LPGRNANPLADELRSLGIDERWIHEIARRQTLHAQEKFTRRSFEESEAVRKGFLDGVAQYLPEETIAEHVTPSYRPWRQRVAVVPDGDIFKGIASGKASMVTDEIDRFTETATGFNLCVLGDINFTVDDKKIDFADTVTFRGMMFTGVPNMAWVFGYFRASWTLRVDLMGDFVCRLLTHMNDKGAHSVTPRLRDEGKDMPLRSWVDAENFNPNYLMRSMHLMPKRGDKPEWQHTQDYWHEKDEFPKIDLDDALFNYQ
jgi:cation diffusion facilitator CzcD-associated flavoprotein CzcO